MELSYTSENHVIVSDGLNTRVATGGAGSRPFHVVSSLPVAYAPADDDVRNTPLSEKGVLA